MKLINILAFVGKSIVAGIVSIVLLCGFVYFYHDTGVHINNTTGATDYMWEPYQRKCTMEEGFACVKMDKNGFNNLAGDVDEIDILLMGSSQMEAVHVKNTENTAAILNSTLYDSYVYNIGMSGHTFYHCMNNIANAVATYRPKEYVILVVDNAELNVDSMNAVCSNTWNKIPSYDSGLFYSVQKYVPSVKTLYKKVDEWKNSSTAQQGIVVSNDYYNSTEYIDALYQFIKLGADITKENDVQLMIVYQPQLGIDSNGVPFTKEDRSAIDQLKKSCSSLEIPFIDMSDAFIKMYYESHCLPHGFTNTAIGSGHLNKYGYQEIANAIISIIGEQCNESK